MNRNLPPSELQLAVQAIKPQLVQAAVFSMIASLMVLAPSGYMLEVYDRVVNSRSHKTLLMLTIMVVIAYVVMEVIEWARNVMMQQAADAFETRLQDRVFNAIFKANLLRQPGGTMQPLNDLKSVREFIASPIVHAIMEAPVALVFLVLVFAISPVLGWFAVIGAIVQTLIGWLNDRSTQPPLAEANRSAIAAQQYVDGTLRNTEVIRAMGMMENIRSIWSAKQNKFLGEQALASEKAGIYQSAGKFWQQVIGSGMLGLACWAFLNNQLNGGSGMMIISSIFGGRVIAPLVQVVSSWQQLINTRMAWDRLTAVLNAMPERPATMPLPAPKGQLVVESLVAGAPGGQAPILKGVSFAVAPGEVLAIVGPTGSGKTTLARLLVGLWPATGGKVRLDGADIFTWNKKELGPHVGYLPQGVELFEGSIAENIARFGDLDRNEIEIAARAVGLHDFILSLPLGYDAMLGREGMQLSGGQRQRVALARALYRRPAYVVLDEPNSSLDEQGDSALLLAITQYKAQGTSFVVITHRTHILQAADKMLVLRDGLVAGFGPRNDVLRALSNANAPQQQPAAA